MNALFWRLIVAVGAVCLSGCIRSLYPLHSEQTTVFDPRLLGEWCKDEEAWTFERRGAGKIYSLSVVDKEGKEAPFEVRLVELGEHRFLDLYPSSLPDEMSDFHKFHLLPVHLFIHVKVGRDKTVLRFPNPEWLAKLLKKDPGAIRHEMIEDSPILSAPTAQLQAFVSKHVDSEGFLTDASELTRATAEADAER